ncbi:hypothetical protein NTGBS_40005 [Candidatus Nitrotoga sp. BS]|uniref:hypothetical protein n=1 Tax=Candidatus Nitrotoga sp. BS TaxID=2890408 RepID=UPI001EF2037C|nr:hypothetical protein [Candidatus Nitrotoga sp. BS]CAH1199734.1 hypothetical protein NTGBS_40005 [Candidatus Nitrotoga sp. BS]
MMGRDAVASGTQQGTGGVEGIGSGIAEGSLAHGLLTGEWQQQTLIPFHRGVRPFRPQELSLGHFYKSR